MKYSFKKRIVVVGCNDTSKQLVDNFRKRSGKVKVAGFFGDQQ